MAYCPSTATIFRTSLCVCTCVCVTDRESGRPRYVGWVECACVCVYLFVQMAYTLIPCSDIGRYVFAYTLCVCERVHKVCVHASVRVSVCVSVRVLRESVLSVCACK